MKFNDIIWYLTFWPLPRAPGGGAKKKCVVARPLHVSNTHTKFGWISSNGLGGDSVTDGRTDGRTDGGDCNIPNAFLKKRGDNEFGKSVHHDCLGLDLKFLVEFVLYYVVLAHNEIIGKRLSCLFSIRTDILVWIWSFRPREYKLFHAQFTWAKGTRWTFVIILCPSCDCP